MFYLDFHYFSIAFLGYGTPDSSLLFNSQQGFSASPQAWIKRTTILQQGHGLGELYFCFPPWNM